MTEPTSKQLPAAIWAVVPAAGIGRRMGAERPKQYLQLTGRTILDQTLDTLLRHPAITGVVIAVSEEDVYWPASQFAQHPNLVRVAGGAERADSVLQALQYLETRLTPEQWVIVHDAVRPCLSHAELDRLLGALARAQDGVVLGVPARDTLKQADAQGRVHKTLDRSQVWHAQTPQIFRLGELAEALLHCRAQGLSVTDEASAMEHCGRAPLLVAGEDTNIKITSPGDLILAEAIVRARGRTG